MSTPVTLAPMTRAEFYSQFQKPGGPTSAGDSITSGLAGTDVATGHPASFHVCSQVWKGTGSFAGKTACIYNIHIQGTNAFLGQAFSWAFLSSGIPTVYLISDGSVGAQDGGIPFSALESTAASITYDLGILTITITPASGQDWRVDTLSIIVLSNSTQPDTVTIATMTAPSFNQYATGSPFQVLTPSS